MLLMGAALVLCKHSAHCGFQIPDSNVSLSNPFGPFGIPTSIPPGPPPTPPPLRQGSFMWHPMFTKGKFTFRWIIPASLVKFSVAIIVLRI